MKDGFRASLVGFIAGIAVGLLLMLSAKWYGENYLGKKFDAYFLSLLGVLGACLGWLIRFVISTITKAIKGMKEELSKKATIDYVNEKIKDERENTKDHFEYMHEFMTRMDNKLDILIGKKK